MVIHDCTSLPVSASMASDDENDGDDGDDEDLGIGDDQTADKIALRTRSSHGVRQSSFSLTREKSASVKPNTPSSQMQSYMLTENALRANKTLLIGRPITIHFPNYGGSSGEVVSYDADKDLYKIEFAVDSYAHYMTFEEAYSLAKLMVWKTSFSSSSSCCAFFGSCSTCCMLSWYRK